MIIYSSLFFKRTQDLSSSLSTHSSAQKPFMAPYDLRPGVNSSICTPKPYPTMGLFPKPHLLPSLLNLRLLPRTSLLPSLQGTLRLRLVVDIPLGLSVASCCFAIIDSSQLCKQGPVLSCPHSRVWASAESSPCLSSSCFTGTLVTSPVTGIHVHICFHQMVFLAAILKHQLMESFPSWIFCFPFPVPGLCTSLLHKRIAAQQKAEAASGTSRPLLPKA